MKNERSGGKRENQESRIRAEGSEMIAKLKSPYKGLLKYL